MLVTLAQLEAFAAVVRYGTFTRAGEELSVSQSAVTQQVQNLQKLFGTTLFDIVGRRPVPTDAGRFLAGRAQELRDAVDALERDMHAFATARSGSLDLGATMTIGNYAVPPILAHFRRLHPEIQLQLEIANTAAICARVKGGILNLALIEGPSHDPDLLEEPYADDELVLIVPPADHALSSKRSITFDTLGGQPLVSRERGSGTREFMDDLFSRAHTNEGPKLEFSSNEGVLRGVESGLGVAILSRICVERSIADGRVRSVAIRDVPLKRKFRIVRTRSRTISPIAESFLNFLRRGR